MLKRVHCSSCSNQIKVKTMKEGGYKGGNYFGKIKLPINGTGRYKEIGTSKIFKNRKSLSIVKWTGKTKEFEYWECDLCYTVALREDWFEERIRKYYGQRCSDFEPSCFLCEVWKLYDKIIKDHSLKGNFRQRYDKEADAAYIHIKRGISVRQIELSDYIILDFDKNNNLLGIEVLDASRCMPKVFSKHR